MREGAQRPARRRAPGSSSRSQVPWRSTRVAGCARGASAGRPRSRQPRGTPATSSAASVARQPRQPSALQRRRIVMPPAPARRVRGPRRTVMVAACRPGRWGSRAGSTARTATRPAPRAAPSRTASSARALVAPHSDTTGVPSAAARWSAPESGPNASAQRREHREQLAERRAPDRDRARAPSRRARDRRRAKRGVGGRAEEHRAASQPAQQRVAARPPSAPGTSGAPDTTSRRRPRPPVAEGPRAARRPARPPRPSARARTRPARRADRARRRRRGTARASAPDALRRAGAGGEQPAALARVGAREADPDRRAASARDERALDAAPEIERDVVATARAARRTNGGTARTPLRRWKTMASSSQGCGCQQRRRRRLDDPREVRLRPTAADASEQRQRADHVADARRAARSGRARRLHRARVRGVERGHVRPAPPAGRRDRACASERASRAGCAAVRAGRAVPRREPRAVEVEHA